MKILYYIPAFGNPNADIKYKILNHNISYIYDQIKKPFDICINFYTHSPDVIINIQKNPFINKLLVYEKKGVLTELFLTNPHNSLIKEYDYILFILDDVRIVNMDIMKMIEIKETIKIAVNAAGIFVVILGKPQTINMVNSTKPIIVMPWSHSHFRPFFFVLMLI